MTLEQLRALRQGDRVRALVQIDDGGELGENDDPDAGTLVYAVPGDLGEVSDDLPGEYGKQIGVNWPRCYGFDPLCAADEIELVELMREA